ncbi:MAG TPA: hypothetical protein VD788_03130 [Candidatus Polarisedimenticolaceae bacterium]|nr:hypothetical protein [Candidatus Polarisedimenticolaceae bacterium]
MRGLGKLMLCFAVAAPTGGAVAATELDEIVAKHVEAKGGDRWKAIETMKMSGSFTAFSIVAPFELIRKRDRKFSLDHEMNGHPVKIGFDDAVLWWDHAMLGPGAKKIPDGPDRHAVEREIDFVTPLFDHAERGFELKLVGPTEFEGFPVIAIELTRPDDTVETWYLDRETYLEFARESPGSDFGTPMTVRTFFDDFRRVEGVMIPFVVESQWYTRDRVMRVEKVEINVPVDDAIFAMPAPLGMASLLPMIDDGWSVSTSIRQQPGAPWEESQRDTEVVGRMRGALIQEAYTSPDGNEVVWSLAYDQFREAYRLIRITDQTNHLDVLVGKFDEQGKLVLSNLETGTTWTGFGMTFHTRVTFHEIGATGFKVDTEISTDGGESWFLAAKQQYARTAD